MMNKLSSPIEEMKEHYQIVVIGSGYGGGIVASRLARAGQEVCVLERGREIHPGDYPKTELDAALETQLNLEIEHIGSRTALYDYHVNDDMTILVGCGLGGTSLINANVAIRPDRRVFEDPRWPQTLRDDVEGLIEEGFDKAVEMLQPVPYPNDFPELAKMQALKRSAETLNLDFNRVPINVTFHDGTNPAGVKQNACILCGDCFSGCNHWAKNTTLMNYLPDASNHGAVFFTKISVRRIERRHDEWIVHYHVLESGEEDVDGPTESVRADLVVLAAGTLGSTEILLRSKEAGLDLSDQLGQSFSGNGDVGGIAYNNDRKTNFVGFGDRDPNRMEPVGPTITGIIDLRDKPELDQGFVIEEGAIPGALESILPATLAKSARLAGQDTDRGFLDKIKEKYRQMVSYLRGAYHGAVNHSLAFLVMAHDDSGGQMKLVEDRVRITWPKIGEQPFVRQVNDQLLEATRTLGGTFVENPMWSKLPSRNMVTAHPLGGCVMAVDGSKGVVNHKGQVFAGQDGEDVYEDLYVCDGAVIPRSVGANPLLTISAISERCCRLIAQDRGWTIDYSFSFDNTDEQQDP
jgi:cholesterol oxidase